MSNADTRTERQGVRTALDALRFSPARDIVEGRVEDPFAPGSVPKPSRIFAEPVPKRRRPSVRQRDILSCMKQTHGVCY